MRRKEHKNKTIVIISRLARLLQFNVSGNNHIDGNGAVLLLNAILFLSIQDLCETDNRDKTAISFKKIEKL